MRNPLRGDLVRLADGGFGVIRSIDRGAPIAEIREGNGLLVVIPWKDFELIPLGPGSESPVNFAEEMRDA